VTVVEQIGEFEDKIKTGWKKLRGKGRVAENSDPPSPQMLWGGDVGTDQEDLLSFLKFVRDETQKQIEWEAAVKAEDTEDDKKKWGMPPIVNLLMNWINQPKVASPYCPKNRASLPALHRTSDSEMEALPNLPNDNAPDLPEQIPLPGFEPVVPVCPSWILWLYDRAGGASMRQGRGAPWDLHLFVGAFLHLAIPDRTGQWIRLRFPHLIEHEADWPIPGTPSIERWLFPDGWDRSNKSRYWKRLPEALHRMSRELSYVPVNELGSVALVFPSVIPERPDQPLVEFTIRVPKSAASGARIDWRRLREYRKESATQYRAYLSVSAFIDRSAYRGHGITAEIASPLLKADGTLLRRKGGKIVRGNELIANPQSRFVKPLDDKDLTRMIGFDAEDRRYRHKAIKAFEKLHDEGIIDMRNDPDGRRIYAPKPKK